MPRYGASHPHSKKRVRSRVHEMQALELRKAGATYDAIGKQLGLTREGARRAFLRAMALMRDDIVESAEEYRQFLIARLDSLLLRVWPAAMNGDLAAIDMARKLIVEQAKIRGVYQTNITMQQQNMVVATTPPAIREIMIEIPSMLEHDTTSKTPFIDERDIPALERQVDAIVSPNEE